jgi:hypothetical protein
LKSGPDKQPHLAEPRWIDGVELGKGGANGGMIIVDRIKSVLGTYLDFSS